MSSDSPQSPAKRLRELSALHDDGLVTDAEFERTRKILLAELGVPVEVDQGEDKEIGKANDLALESESETGVLDRLYGRPQSPDHSWGTKKEWFVRAVALAVLLLVVLAFNLRNIEYWVFPEREAYDAGAQTMRGWNMFPGDGSCVSLIEAAGSKTSSDFVLKVLRIDQAVLEKAETVRTNAGATRWESEDNVYFASGFWDATKQECPQVFNDPSIVGRP